MSKKEMQRLFDEAIEAWKPTRASVSATAVVVEAENGSGSRYVVVATELPRSAMSIVGGSKLVSLMSPWQAAYPVNSGANGLHDTYLLEKFVPYGKKCGPQDAAGIVQTIREAVRALDHRNGRGDG